MFASRIKAASKAVGGKAPDVTARADDGAAKSKPRPSPSSSPFSRHGSKSFADRRPARDDAKRPAAPTPDRSNYPRLIPLDQIKKEADNASDDKKKPTLKNKNVNTKPPRARPANDKQHDKQQPRSNKNDRKRDAPVIKREEKDNNDSKNEEGDRDEPKQEQKSKKRHVQPQQPEDDKPKEEREAYEARHNTELSRTLFVRNLDPSTEEEDFGPLVYAKVVKHPETGVARGSGFVLFVEKEDADAAFNAAQVPFKSQKKPQAKDGPDLGLVTSGLAAIRDDDDENGIVCCGRILRVDYAVDKTKAADIKMDKRNLYLAEEGRVVPESEAAEGVSDYDMKKRTQFDVEKRAKLKLPNYHVSRTRLSIRNLPKDINDGELNKICREAASVGKTVFGGDEDYAAKRAKEDERLDLPVKIRQVKILKEPWIDNNGIAFVEFAHHIDALGCLRALNNNPDIFTKNRRPIVEFAIDDVRKVQAMMERFAKNIKQRKQQQSNDEEEAPKKKQEPLNKSQWRRANTTASGKPKFKKPFKKHAPTKPNSTSKSNK